ncbi:raptor N-terminal caspase like domain-domain-containing protein [Lobosporangium transversale]|uniref:Raptor N-terminal caspase like domain-domain-containing protein n=1 Tax=Lobosporangium transversale TaxID=64571 RepID=A0A1Y2GPH2_9FUNG|nr:raptor N-terminal caspase like domain-domain-containing protein [Lobosporangium transversale]ORZ16165.1 raptor N-terminal caspase like domain-domain-containing protein [Lobosporangium transversale]|eukprot:XP_021881512.1 raptor N-terminal caspase like domain-domain-containing protein [Lobosporangium transversale]
MRPRQADNENNEDAKSTNSTLVNAGMNSANEQDDDAEPTQDSHTNGFRHQGGPADADSEEDEWHTYRHGFDLDFDEHGLPPEHVYYMFYTDKRHEVTTGHNAEITLREWEPLQDWRMREKLKTISVALVLCLNIGIDPPDVVKTNPCAKLEAWIDPFVLPVPKSLENIGKALQAQYEVWQPRARYKAALDPSMEDTKKLCCVLRRNAKEERILFHYNGHGVPKPTSSGEIWVFNKNYTQYIPVSLMDLQSWLGSPCIYVYDCSAAGNILLSFNRFAEKRDLEAAKQAASQPPGTIPSPPLRDCIQLAACGPDDTLPMNPDLPADIFTACLTTPIEIALRWFVLQHPLLHNVTVEMVTRIPGKLNDRRTPLGELNWIFTSITDTIAWNVLSRDLFKTLFRQDLMVAALFRNFLLADRIMRSQKCTPMSSPALPPTHQHPMWDSWDLALDMCLAQLPGLLQGEGAGSPLDYQPSMFFTEQLMAFEVWLSHGSPSHEAPEQLAIVLQVLLSQVHRLRALLLLSQFLDLGPWAVNHALAVGISPYVLKLLQSPAADLKPVLVFIWARLLAVDRSFQNDLLKDNGFVYFVGILGVNAGMPPLRNVSEHRAMCAFILATFCRDFSQGQQACLKQQVIQYCLTHVADSDHLLRQWACLCIGQLWKNYNEAKSVGLQLGAHDRLTQILTDPVPEVRAAAMWSLGTFISNLDQNEQVIQLQNNLAMRSLVATTDASPIVRKELVIFLSSLVLDHSDSFVQVASELLAAEQQQVPTGKLDSKSKFAEERADKMGPQAVYSVIWKALLCLSVDSNRGVAVAACKLVDYINYQLLSGPVAQTLTPMLQQHALRSQALSSSSTNPLQSSSPQATPDRTSSSATLSHRTAAKMANTLKRSASLAVTLKNYIPGYSSQSSAVEAPRVGLGGLSGTSGSKSSQDGAHLSSADSRQTNGGANGTNRSTRSTASRPRSVHGDVGYVQAQASPSYTPVNQGTGAAVANGALDPDHPEAKPQLESVFYDWCCEYFLEPQMKGVEGDEPGSINYNERLWRRVRNEKIIYECHPLREQAGLSKWDTNIQSMNNESAAMHLVMHSYEPHVVIADDKRNISVWNWREGQLLNRFSNSNPRGTSITSVKYINEDDIAMLLVASGEGVVRLYRKYDEPNQTDIVTSWRVLTDMLPSSKSTGTITDWQQGRGALLVGGDARVIRVWDAARELCISDIPTRSGAPVTSITSDQVSGNIFVVGFGDGAVRVYDRRQPQHEALVMTWKKHKSWIQNVRMQRGGFRELVSGSVDGTVKVWDVRHQESLQTIVARDPISALDLHHHAPVLAW